MVQQHYEKLALTTVKSKVRLKTLFGQITNCTKLWIYFYFFKHSEF